MTDAEKKLAHIKEMEKIRRQRYRERHGFRYFSVQLDKDRFEKLEKKLAKDNITKKQFLDNAIDKFLEE